MSYNVYLHCGACGSNQIEHTNMTSNLARMWDEAGAPLRDWNGRTAVEVLPLLQRAIERLRSDPEDFEHLNPSNGWGDLRGCVEFLEGIRDACARNPHSTLSVGH